MEQQNMNRNAPTASILGSFSHFESHLALTFDQPLMG